MTKLAAAAVIEQPPQLPGYEPVRCLGRGATGSVWLMAPDDGGPCLAAKSLTPVGAGGADANAATPRHNDSQITHEWRVLSQFRHDHLIPVHRVVNDAAGTPVLLMDHAAGGSLEQVVRSRGPLEVGEAVTVLTPMGQVLAFLHGKGAVHGDVSPGNVLLSSAGKPLLSDVGFGRVLGQGVEVLAGTPGFYCSTDRVRDEAADVYALAAVGWYALTGRPAPPTHNRVPLGSILQDVPSELVAALEAGLADNPAHRPTAAAFAQAVFRSAAAVPVALGHAVHPSVVPELLTRQEAKGRRVNGRGDAPGRRAHHALRWPAQRRPWWFRLGEFRLRELRLREFRRRRHSGRMGWLWGSEVAKPRRAGAGPRRARLSAGAVVVIAAVVAAGMALALALAMSNSGWLGVAALDPLDASPATNTPSAAPAVPAWAAVLPPIVQKGLLSDSAAEALPALAWLRSYAFSVADPALLSQVNATGSPAASADSAVMASLQERGHSFTGLETSIDQATIVHLATNPAREGTAGPGGAGGGDGSGARRVMAHATVTTSAFAELDTAGNLVHRQDEEQQQALRMVLILADGRWVIEEILPAEKQK